jgi:dolichol-phosphate mannosyltransferase
MHGSQLDVPEDGRTRTRAVGTALTDWRRRVGGAPAVVTAALATTLVVAGGRSLSHPTHLALTLLACAAYLLLITRPGGSRLSIRLVSLAIAVEVAASLAVMPSATQDIWWYAIYGRILSIHHASPWTHVAANFPHDPIVALVGHTWRHTPSVYGPAFTAVSGAATLVLGTSQLGIRIFYQGLAAIALVAISVIIWRRTKSALAVAFLALNPLIALYLVNGGRNDILVALSLLVAVVLVQRRRPGAAGLAAALGALVKLTGLVGAVAIAVSLVLRGDLRAARRFVFVTFASVAVASVAAGPVSLLTPMKTAGARYSRASAWQVIHIFGGSLPSTHVALLVTGVVACWVLVRSARSGPEVAVPATVTALTLGASWALPGYAAWAMPTAALRPRSPISRIVAYQAVVLVAAYEIVRHPIPGSIGHLLFLLATVGGPLCGLALLVRLVHCVRVQSVTPPEEKPHMTSTRLQLAPREDPDLVSSALVVIPTLNEVDNIETLIRRIRTTAPTVDILIVDDASPDGTAARAEELGRLFGHVEVMHRNGAPGLGAAYRDGFAYAIDHHYDAVVEMDADLSHDPATIPAILQALRDGADLVVGSRYIRGGATPGWPRRRRLLSRAAGLYAGQTLRLHSTDPTGGFRGFRTGLLRKCEIDTVQANGFGFQLEMLHRARRLGATVREVPIVFRDRTAGISKLSPAIAREALWLVAQLRLHPWSPTSRPEIVPDTEAPVPEALIA